MVRYENFKTTLNIYVEPEVDILTEKPMVSSDLANAIDETLDNSFAWSLVVNFFKRGFVDTVLGHGFATGITRSQWTLADASVCQRLAKEYGCSTDLLRKLYDISATNQIVSAVLQVEGENDPFAAVRYGIYLELSRVNHSCDPNTQLKFTKAGVTLVSLRPIAAGEEVTFSYIPAPTREALFKQYGFTCTCQVCVKNCLCGAPAILRCAKCPYNMKYCSKNCQIAHWTKEHKYLHPSLRGK